MGRKERGLQKPLVVILSESEASRKSLITCEVPRSARDDELAYTDFQKCCSGGCVSRRCARRGECLYASLQENFPGTTPRVSISRKIHFRDSSVTIGERTDALDRVESNVRDVLRPQPFQERPALKRDWQPTKLYDGEICMCRIT